MEWGIEWSGWDRGEVGQETLNFVNFVLYW